MTLRLSVVVAARNAAGTIEEALDSVLNQTLPVDEVLVGLDASSDGTREIVDRIACRDVRVRTLGSSNRLGPGGMRQRLVESACGAYIAILDADDAWRPKRWETLAPLLKSGEVDIVSDDICFWIDGKREAGTLCREHAFRPAIPAPIQASTMIRKDLGWLKPIVRRELLLGEGNGYRPGVDHSEDFDLYLRLLRRKACWIHHPEDGYLYRKHSASLSRDWKRGLEESRIVLERLRSEIPEPGLRVLLRRRVREKEAIFRFYTILESWREEGSLRCFRRILSFELVRAVFVLALVRLDRRFL